MEIFMNRRDALQTLLGTAGFLAFNPGLPLFAADAPVASTIVSGGAEAPLATPQPPANLVPKVDFDTAPIKTEGVVPNLHLISGPGGNIAVFEGAEGLTVIDAGVASRAKEIVATISGMSSKPISNLINTHWHFDHVGANEAIGSAGARIYAHENVRKRLSQTTHIEFFGNDVPPLPLVALPAVTFEQGVAFRAEGFQVTHVPPAPTDGDSFVFFSDLKVLHTGDLFFNGFYPFIDSSTGGSIDGVISGADRMLSLINGDTKIIPGHGPIGKRADLINFRDMLVSARDKIKPLFDAGKSLEETIAAKPTANLDPQWATKGFLTGDMFTKVVYLCLKRAAPVKPV
jgi:cyclase